MPKKILILKSSPRIHGNSNTLAERAATGARDMGADVKVFNLHDMDIRPCDACDECRETGGVCVIGDEMQALYPRLREADAIVLASPIYWFTMSAQLKVCIDRWYAMQTPNGNELGGKQFGIVLTYGDSDLHNSGGINAIHTFESMFRYLEANIAGIVHGSADAAGEINKQPALLERAYQLGQKLVGES
jgi:multimeric flavodoxin WrbA